MVNPELESYVRESRAAGVSDDQIRQALAAQGWVPADISEALASSSNLSASAVPTVVHNGMNMKVIMAIGAIVLLLGAGGYFFLMKDGSSSENLGSNTSNVNKSSTSSKAFDCKTLMSDSQFESSTGLKMGDYNLVTDGEDLVKQGLNMLPGHEGTGDLVESSGVVQVICSYVKKSEPQIFAGGDVIVSITWGGVGAEKAYNVGRNIELGYKGQTELSSPNLGTIKYPQPHPGPVDVTGVGSEAYFTVSPFEPEVKNYLQVLSSNKRFDISVKVDEEISNSENIAIAVAKVYDASLNKY